jgi:hypothetical protein
MAKSLTNFDFPAPLAEKVTGASLVQQRNWMARGQLHSATQPPLAGKPRMFSLLSLYECAAYVHGSSHGIPVAVLSAAFRLRVIATGEKILVDGMRAECREVGAFWAEDAIDAAVKSGELREFEDPDDRYFWLISARHTPAIAHSPIIQAFEFAKEADLDAAIGRVAKASGGATSHFSVFGISGIVRAVDAALAANKVSE